MRMTTGVCLASRPPRRGRTVRGGCRRVAAAPSPSPSPSRSSDPVADWINAHCSADLGRVIDAGLGGGGSGWARTCVYDTDTGQKIFAKASGRSAESMFRGEAEGLRAMKAAGTELRVPTVFGCDDLEAGGSFVAMEYLALRSTVDQFKLGKELGKMHVAKPSMKEALEGRFGFNINNTIGGTPQPNAWSNATGVEGWIEFYGEQRLKHQLDLAGDPDWQRMGRALIERLPDLFSDLEISPGIIHGDLWSGNIGWAPGAGDDSDGAPAIFDPACYYAHHEAEFGMSWCANFGHDFWRGYRSIIPEDPGFQRRKSLYQLYHYLNHFNLFGAGYYSQCSSILRNLSSS